MHPPPSRTKACFPCIRSKRRCDKGKPSCQRCISREISCEYSSKRPYSRQPKPDVEPSLDAANPHPGQHQPEWALTSKEIDIDGSLFAFFQELDSRQDGCDFNACLDFQGTASSSPLYPSQPAAQQHSSLREKSHLVRLAAVKSFVKQIGNWMREWTVRAHCPFIHRELHAETGLPECLQDAFGCLTAYTAKTDDNEYYVWRLIESKANALFMSEQSCSLPITPASMCELTQPATNAELAMLLSKVQAGVIYQHLRLFDGDICQRAQAERHICILTGWLKQLLPVAASAPQLDVACQSPVDLWRDWVLKESMRRTWMVTAYMQSIYLMLRDNETNCSGKIHCTMREGVWDAPSAAEWFQLLNEKDPLFWELDPAEVLFAKVSPGEIDRFVHSTIAVM
ncbi:hypothetical protein K4F52_002808 [Lecanicillium sp. MT-2017a]|nr:hypothetical protein K4F52_002808 [Lecanicillium sp. MT-2017a]